MGIEIFAPGELPFSATIGILAVIIMDLAFRENYWGSPERKKAFLAYLVQVFGLDLSLWDKLGFWDDRYRPFSYFDDDSVVSNVCVYSMDMAVQGRCCRVAQLSAVGTLPEYRRKGLSRKLIKAAMDWARDTHDFFYLFADEEAYGFYRPFGFRPVEEYKARLAVTGMAARPGIVRLDMSRPENIAEVFRIASRREPVSDMLGVSNAKLLMYWCLYGLREYVYYIRDLDVLVLYKRASRLLTIYDVVGSTMPTFDDIYPYLCDPDVDAVEFLFMTDKLQLTEAEHTKVEGNGTHVHGNFPFEDAPFLFPLTSQA